MKPMLAIAFTVLALLVASSTLTRADQSVAAPGVPPNIVAPATRTADDSPQKTGDSNSEIDPREQVLVPIPPSLSSSPSQQPGVAVPHGAKAPGKAAPAQTITVQGILGADISEFQGDVDWKKLSTGKKKFVYIRASHGDEMDIKFAVNWKGAADNGVVRGAYHFFNPHQSVDKQIRLFVNGVHRLEKGDLPPMIDVETPKLWRRIPQKDRVPLLMKFITAVEQNLGVKPILYMSPKFVGGTLGAKYVEPLSAYPVWLAHYEVSEPLVPALWGKFVFWQYSETGNCEGIKGPCDEDVFPGTFQDLIKWTLQVAVEATYLPEILDPPPPHKRWHGRGHGGGHRHPPNHHGGRSWHGHHGKTHGGGHWHQGRAHWGGRHCHHGRCR